MNKRGEVVVGAIVASTLILGLVGTGLYKTHKNGVLKNNGKKIWCKMQNKGASYCDALYQFEPKPHHWELETRTYKVPVYVEGE